jgi:hypothetical protein
LYASLDFIASLNPTDSEQDMISTFYKAASNNSHTWTDILWISGGAFNANKPINVLLTSFSQCTISNKIK